MQTSQFINGTHVSMTKAWKDVSRRRHWSSAPEISIAATPPPQTALTDAGAGAEGDAQGMRASMHPTRVLHRIHVQDWNKAVALSLAGSTMPLKGRMPYSRRN